MKSLKPWQIGLFIAAVVVVGLSAWWTFGRGDNLNLADRAYLIDIESGDLFYSSVKGRRGVMAVMPHPETKKLTLIRVDESADGTWIVASRYLDALKEMEGQNKVVDAKSGTATPSNASPRSLN